MSLAATCRVVLVLRHAADPEDQALQLRLGQPEAPEILAGHNGADLLHPSSPK
jgi:hypothetical protein